MILFFRAGLKIEDSISQFHRKITSESFGFFNIKTIYPKEPFSWKRIRLLITFSEHEAKGNKNIKMK